MSLFSGIIKFFKKIFSAIKKLLTKFFEMLGPFLPLLLVLAFVFWPYLTVWLAEIGWTTAAAGWATLGAWVEGFGVYGAVVAGLGVSMLVSPEQTIEAIHDVAESAGEIVGSVVGGATGGVASGLFESVPSWLWLIGGGLLVYYLFSSDSTSENVPNRISSGEVKDV